MDILETARLLRFQTEWELRFERYERLLLDAGISQDEAIRIVTLAEADRMAEIDHRRAA